MDEILSCLIEEVNRCRGLAKIPGIETFRDEYLHKAELLERAAEIVRKVAAIGPHGRLGDLDALKERATNRLYASNHGSMAETYWAAIIDMIDSAPTIIPARKDGET